MIFSKLLGFLLLRKFQTWFYPFFLLILVTFFSGCSKILPKNEFLPLTENDPLLESFYGRGVKMTLVKDSESLLIVDTICFDMNGRIVEKIELYSRIRLEYDSIGNLIRKLILNDIPSNYLIEYEIADKLVYQKWFLLSHLNWELGNEKLEDPDRVILYKFDENGKIQQEEDLGIGEITKYEYEDSRLSSKLVYFNSSPEPTIRWTYLYRANGLLENIKCWSKERLISDHYFGVDGMLDSTIMKGYTLTYAYKY